MAHKHTHRQRDTPEPQTHTHSDKPEGVGLEHCPAYQAHLILGGDDVEVEVAHGVERWPVEAQPGSVR